MPNLPEGPAAVKTFTVSICIFADKKTDIQLDVSGPEFRMTFIHEVDNAT